MFTIAGDMDHCNSKHMLWITVSVGLLATNMAYSLPLFLLLVKGGPRKTTTPWQADKHDKLERDLGFYQDDHSSTDLQGIKVL